MVVLALTLQKCTIQYGMPPGVLCGVVQELCRYLSSLVEKGDLLDLTMLDMEKKDSMAPPVPIEGASSPEPRVKEPISLPAKKAAHSGELALVQRFTCSWVGESIPPSLEDADCPMSIALGAQ